MRIRRKKIEIRNKYWNIISPAVTQEPFIYYREKRGSIIKQIVERYNNGKNEKKLIEKTVYTLMRRYWQRGKNESALLPDYENSGGKGKRKTPGDKKRGRPKIYSHDEAIGNGINITDKDKKLFRLAIARFYHTPKQNSFAYAYDQMIKDYYTDEIIYEDNGTRRHELIPPDKRPTLAQFKYWYGEEVDITKKLKSRKGANRFALEDRAILGNSTSETYGPGSRFQIDATIADIYLVSTYNRDWIIGRPVIYIVIDVFSRMVVGVYVGLEGPSWIGAMMALSNAASDKVTFCKEYGVEITESQWPCRCLPDAILGDRGELLGMTVETSIRNLGIRIENAAPYRADWKGIVERYFGTIHGHIKPFMPGFIEKDYRQRGTKDYRLESLLSLEQFTECVINIILYHNSQHRMDKYQRDLNMIADNVPPIPKELWKWGISKYTGKIMSPPEDLVKLNLLPTGNATVTDRGIRFKGVYYTYEKKKQENLSVEARSNSSLHSDRKLKISYDIRNLNYIYVVNEDGRSFEKCYLIDEERYLNKDLYNVEYLLAYENYEKQRHEGQEQQDKIDLIDKIENVVSKAKKSKSESHQNIQISNNKKLSGIRENRHLERSKRRRNEGFNLGEIKNKDVSDSVESKELVQQQSLQPNYQDLIKKKWQEQKDEQNK